MVKRSIHCYHCCVDRRMRSPRRVGTYFGSAECTGLPRKCSSFPGSFLSPGISRSPRTISRNAPCVVGNASESQDPSFYETGKILFAVPLHWGIRLTRRPELSLVANTRWARWPLRCAKGLGVLVCSANRFSPDSVLVPDNPPSIGLSPCRYGLSLPTIRSEPTLQAKYRIHGVHFFFRDRHLKTI